MAGRLNRVVYVALTLCLSLLSALQGAYCKEAERKLGQYQITMSTVFAHGDNQQVVNRARALLDYRDGANAADLSITPQMLQYQDHRYRFRVNSFDDAGSAAKLGGIIRQGMLLSREGQQPPALTFKAQQAWQAYNDRQGDKARAALAPLLSLFHLSPVIAHANTPESGGVIAPVLGEFTDWQVEEREGELTTASLLNAYQQEGVAYRHFGRLTYHHQTGLLDKLLLVEQKRLGEKLETRRWVMAPKDSRYVSSMLWQDEGEIDYDEPDDSLYEITPLAKTPDDPDGAASMMAQAQGIMSAGWGGDDIELRYIHGLVPGDYATSVVYSNIELIDWQERVIDLPLWVHSSSGARAFGGVVSSQLNLLPLGWGESKTKLDELEHIRAELRLTPVKRVSKSLPWQQLLSAPYRYGDSTLTLEAMNTTGRYRLSVTSRGNYALSPNFNGLIGQLRLENMVYHGPEWLSMTEQMLLDELFTLEPPPTVYILQLAQTPKSLELLHLESLVDAQISRSVKFVRQSEYDANLENPPMQLSEQTASKPKPSGKLTPRDGLSQLTTVSLSGHDLFIPLPTALANWCQPEITQGFNEGEMPVVWRLVSDGQGQSAYLLTTEDDTRHYFYDQQVAGTIRCQGEPKWHEILIKPGERPWLVDFSALVSHTGGDSQEPMSLRSLLITDASGRRLNPRLPKGSQGDTLDSALIDGSWLSVDGAARRAAYLEVSHTPLTIPYKFHFKPLP
ncbi:hypothetical protein [Shewanella marisflavi]|uniref:Uncharacterized protein n=1 Tax=Shewanella marisflavi TaxID=260364 RepID=A0AAC9XMW6_9GAMM|nr:hypothetical protein [Shewanella marisflavi]ASJ96352.1 hypothetical protein CFF01_06990 [Shewanella marisflavi]